MIKLRTKEGVEVPDAIEPGDSKINLIANSVLRAFKGDTEITGAKLQKMKDGFKERNYIKLRPFERILFGTGVVLEESDYKIELLSDFNISLKKGLLTTPGTINPSIEEIGVIMYNSTPFLNKVEKHEIIAKLTFNFA